MKTRTEFSAGENVMLLAVSGFPALTVLHMRLPSLSPPSLDHSMDNCPSVFNPDQEHTWAPRQPGAVGDACTTKGEFSPLALAETDKLWKA